VSAVPEAEPRPAASVVVMRPGPGGLEVLLLQRNGALAFHGGAWVFPGGRVDPADRKAATGDRDAAWRRAAVREAREEAGITLDPSALVRLSRWTTPEGQPRRFLTWFFLAHARADRIVVDGGEIVAHRWITPAAALAERARGTLALPPPTFVTLWHLDACRSPTAAFDAARRRSPVIYEPRPRPHEGGIVSLYAPDIAYNGGALEEPGARHRLWMLGSGWRYERSGDA
jgi:8-oxo-dGTP pyrophosphatase MutT (NUDIX family)